MESQAAVFDERVEGVTSGPVESTIEQSEKRQTVTTLTNSISGTFSKITDRAVSFGHRRRRTTDLAISSSSPSLTPLLANDHYPSRLPTPISTTSRSRDLAPKAKQSQDENSNPSVSHTSNERPVRRISEKFSSLPFFHYEKARRESQAPDPSQPRRNFSMKIEQRGLIAPIQPSALPRSTTLNNISEIRSQHSSSNQTMTSPSRPQDMIESVPNQSTSFAPGPATRSNLRSPSSSSRRPYLKSPAPPFPTSSSKSASKLPQVPSYRSNMRSPTSYRQTSRRSYVKSPAPPIMTASTKPSPQFLGRKDTINVRNPGPTPSFIPAPTSSSAPRQSLPSQVRMLSRSAIISPGTRLPMPTTGLHTPEYARTDEDKRDKLAEPAEIASSNSSRSAVNLKTSSISTASDLDELTPLIRSASRDPRPVTPPPPFPSPNPPPSPPSPPPPPPPTPEPNPNSDTTTPPPRTVRFTLTPQNLHPDNAQLVYEAQPTRYWLARHETLASFLRTAALNGDPFPHPFPPPPERPLPPPPRFSSLLARSSRGRRDVSAPEPARDVTPAMTQSQRDRLIFLQLRARCVTDEARESLDGFIREWVRRRVVVEEAPLLMPVEEEKRRFLGRRH